MFATWLIEKLDHPGKPLASVAVILSEAETARFENSKTQKSYKVPRGEADDIEEVIGAWAERCAENPDNLAFFFFCGHGVSEGAMSALLMRDYGAKRTNAFDGAINLGELLAAMQTRLPNRQLFIIDACRVSTPLSSFNRQRTTIGRTCLQAEPGGRLTASGPCLQSALHSTLEGSAAYGRAGKPSCTPRHSSRH
jgi:hypothetical protein